MNTTIGKCATEEFSGTCPKVELRAGDVLSYRHCHQYLINGNYPESDILILTTTIFS